MPKIELTNEQRQALAAAQGKPGHVVGPAAQGPSPSVPPPPGPSPGEGEPVRVRLRDLPTPPEVIAEAERWCVKYGWRGKKTRQGVEAQLKLQYYYGGQAIYLLPGPQGPVVLPITERHQNTPELRYVLLTPEERPHACLDIPPRWRETTSEILS